MSRDPDPRVTVVVPAYNSARWIRDTLASVVAQDVPPKDLEVVVVDDGSTDGTAEVAEGWMAAKSTRWKVIRQANKGPGAARNVGYRAGVGRWVQFLDADDLIDPEKVSRQLAVADAHPEVAVVFAPWAKFGVMDRRWEELDRPFFPVLEPDVPTAMLSGRATVATGSELYSRAWLDRVGGWDERYPNGEDHDLRVRLAFAGGEYIPTPSDRPLFFYRRHPPAVVSLTSRSGRANSEVWVRLAETAEREWRRLGELTPERVALLARLIGGAARGLAHYDWVAARHALDRALQLDPGFRYHGPGKLALLARVFGPHTAVRLAGLAGRWAGRCGTAADLVTVPPPAFACHVQPSSA